MGGLQVKVADTTDSGTVIHIIAECQKVLLDQGIRQWAPQYPTEQDVRGGIEGGMTYLLLADGQPVGTVAMEHQMPEQAKDLPWLTPWGKSMVVHRLAVLPQHRHKGYAKYLMRFVEQKAAGSGYLSLRLGAYSENPAAVSLYEGLGYRRIGQVVVPFREKPFVCMEKLLTSASSAPEGMKKGAGGDEGV